MRGRAVEALDQLLTRLGDSEVDKEPGRIGMLGLGPKTDRMNGDYDRVGGCDPFHGRAPFLLLLDAMGVRHSERELPGDEELGEEIMPFPPLYLLFRQRAHEVFSFL